MTKFSTSRCCLVSKSIISYIIIIYDHHNYSYYITLMDHELWSYIQKNSLYFISLIRLWVSVWLSQNWNIWLWLLFEVWFWSHLMASEWTNIMKTLDENVEKINSTKQSRFSNLSRDGSIRKYRRRGGTSFKKPTEDSQWSYSY